MLDGHGDLCAAEIAFFAPTLVLGAFICLRHGLNGWLYTVILSMLRLIGASCLLYAEANNDSDQNLIIAYAVCSSIGTAPLLLVLMGCLKRISQGMERKALGWKSFVPIQVLSITALILAIIGGTDQSSSDSSDIHTGRMLNRAAAILFLAVWGALSGITVLTYTRIRWVLPTEYKLLYAVMISIPFLMVRVAYSVAVAFSSSPSSPFYTWNVNAWVQGFMQFSMEAVVMIIYVSAGLMTPKALKLDLREGEAEDAALKLGLRHGAQEMEMESGRIASYPPRR